MTAPDTFADSPADPDRGRRFGLVRIAREVALGAALVLGSGLLGLLMGLLWHAIAPRVPLYADTTAVYPRDPEGEQAIGADMTFAMLGAGWGLLVAVVAYLLTRARAGGVAVPVGLALGGGLGGWLAMLVGQDESSNAVLLALAKSVPTGTTFDAPLQLGGKLVLLAWPMVALLVLITLIGLFSSHPELADVPPQTPQDELPEAG